MHLNFTRKKLTAALPVAAMMLFGLSAAQASPTGTLAVDSCAGKVKVDATTIDFTAGAGFPTQCVQAGSTTNVTSSFGNLGPAIMGTISDLSGPIPPGFVFLSFDPPGGTAGLLNFILLSVGPGSANTDCSLATDTISCSLLLAPGVISPFILSGSTAFGTTAILNVNGTVTDATGTSTWAGKFSANFAGSPAQVEAQFRSAGFIESTYSGDLRLTVGSQVPEPGSLALLGFGFLGFGLLVRRRTQRVIR